MEKDIHLVEERYTLNKIIDDAVGLPTESLDLLLMMAKAMRYTRYCIMNPNMSCWPEKVKKPRK